MPIPDKNQKFPLQHYERLCFLKNVITNPNIAYILMLIGIYGLLFEFYSPGAIVPGVVGAICLILALYAFHVLPINYSGLALVVIGVSLMISEAFVPSFGALGLGGATAFVIGSVMLMDVDAPGFTVSPMLIGSVAAVSSGLFFVVMMMLLRSRKRAVVTGLEQLLDSRAKVIDWQDDHGHVRVHGEIWSARATSELQPGRLVNVSSIDGLTRSNGSVSHAGKDKMSSVPKYNRRSAARRSASAVVGVAIKTGRRSDSVTIAAIAIARAGSATASTDVARPMTLVTASSSATTRGRRSKLTR